PRPTYHTRQTDERPPLQWRVIAAQQREVAYAIDLVVIGDAAIAIAETDLRPDVEIELGAALGDITVVGAAFRPCVGWKWPGGHAPAAFAACLGSNNQKEGDCYRGQPPHC